MCGRFSLGTAPDLLAAVFQLATVPQWRPRHNLAPAEDVPVIRIDEQGNRRLDLLHWGFVPSWADDPAIGNRMINARSETAAQKPAFRSAFRSRRCLIPADAFYEWQKQGKRKQPFAIRMKDSKPFAMAGLWETWRSKDGQELQSFTILTTVSNSLVSPLHNRMPVIIDPAQYQAWLSREMKDVDELQAMLHSLSGEQMIAYPVSTQINRAGAGHDGPECLLPVQVSQSEPELLF